LSIVTCE